MEQNKLHSFSLESIQNKEILGRTGTDGSSLVLFWTASGVRVKCTCGELWACLEGDWNVQEPWVSVWVNGEPVSRFVVAKGKQWYCLFRGLPVGKQNTITLLKETQAMSGDDCHLLKVHAFGVSDAAVTGVCGTDDDRDEVIAQKLFVEQEEPHMKIEFIGDSITTGEGLAGGAKEMDWIAGWMSLRDNYALLTAKSSDAEFRILSQSGWGVTGTWDNDRNGALPLYYDKVCGLAFGERNASFGAQQKWDFALWQPDVVVVNLGTNDWGAFNQPAKKDPVSGAEWKLHLDAHGKPVSADLQFFTQGVFDFLKKVRLYNPHATIIWAYGMCSFDLGRDIKNTVARFARETGDADVHFVRLDSMSLEKKDERGSRQHPGPVTHRRAAKKIATLIRKIRGNR